MPQDRGAEGLDLVSGGRGLGTGLTLAAVLLGGAVGARAQAVTAIPKLDIEQAKGTWYELRRLPNSREKKCNGDAFMLITDGDKARHLLLVNSCKIKTGDPYVFNGKAKFQGKSDDGRLKVTYLWPFSHKYWVLATGPEYAWALVGSPNHKNLWVLSKTTTLAPEVLTEIQAKAAAEGYRTDKLETVTQSRRLRSGNSEVPASSVAPAPPVKTVPEKP